MSPQARVGIDGSEGNVLPSIVDVTQAYTFYALNFIIFGATREEK